MHSQFNLEPLDQRVLLSAPTSINSLHFAMNVRSASDGKVGTFTIDIGKHGHNFVLVPGTRNATGAGSCSYTVTGANSALVSFDDTVDHVTGTIAFTFTVSRGGTFKVNTSSGLYEKGVFSF